ncbi:MAG: hypothetical protein KKG79_00005, partial [Acidobacteria bacterium]|nr:hypothetical protein [Acidobacteriota bacterium]
MKKTLFLLLLISLVLSVSSCKRSAIDDPDWDSPVGFYVLLEGSANPAVLLIDGNIHTSKIYVRASDSKGNSLPGKTIYLAQFDSASHQQVSWGYFENNASTIQKVTNANGEISATYFWPVEWLSSSMYIHALMVIDGHSYSDTLPQDYISLTLVRSDSHSNNGPVVNILSPSDNAVVSGTVAISAVAIDAADGIKRVDCYIDGQMIGYQAGSATSDSYSFNWDTSEYSNNRHTIDVVAIDNAGASGSDSVRVTVNNTQSDSPPDVVLIYPLDKSNIAPGQIMVLANAEDDIGINHVDLYVNDVFFGKTDFNGARVANFQLAYTMTNAETKFYVIAWDTIGQKTV